MVTIRAENLEDASAIRSVVASAFPTDAEARLVDRLRETGFLSLSLVADEAGVVVGHVALSPVTINDELIGLGLAPLAVLPARQRQGFGSELMRSAIDSCKQSGIGCIVLLGSPAYYGRFGFVPASRWRLSDDYQGGDHFQALELKPQAIPSTGGRVRYAPPFHEFAW
jgi:putative acetyltransferase